jgi:hypothetical protein
VEAKLVGDLGGIHGVGKVLGCQPDEKAKRVSAQPTCLFANTRRRASRSSSSLNMRCTASSACPTSEPLTLLARLGDTLPVVRVDNEDDALGVLEVWWGQCEL